MRFPNARPSPAIVLAVLALVFAMVGSAVAGTDGLSSKLTKSKVKQIAKKQADKELKANVTDSHVNLADNATEAVHAQSADSATEAVHAQTADSATTATTANTATNADNADQLGGLPADNYARRLFAKVAYSNANPTILAASPGVVTSGEGALGFPRVTFPQSMNNCAIIATTSSAAGTSIVRHSTAVSGTQVQLAIQDGANAPVRTNFSVVGVC